jgi:polyadenylate-binding protein
VRLCLPLALANALKLPLPKNPKKIEKFQKTQKMNTNSNFNSASLYIGDLHESVTEAFLYEVFREIGPIVSIRVCRDAVTRKSLGYAYINFQNPADAERALDAMNYAMIKGKPIRIMWSQRDPSVRKSGIGNVFIKNLDKSIDNKILYDTFSAFGNILSCKVATKLERTINKETGEVEEKIVSKGYGFVHFETQEAAEQAMAKVNGMLLGGKKVYVGPFIKRNERLKLYNADDKFTNVYIKNLDKSVTTEDIEKMFSEFGTIQHAAVMSDDQGRSKGFAFVNFEKHEDAKKAVDALNNKDIKGKKIYVGRAQKKNERQALLKELVEKKKLEKQNKYAGVNLYVKNLDDNVDDEKLKEIFAKYGAISSAHIMRDDKDNTSKGFGFVCFENPEDATKAMTELNGRIVGSKPLYVAVAQKKEVRRQQLEAQYRARSFNAPHMPPQGMPFPPQMAFPYPPQQGHMGRGFGVPPMMRPRWAAVPQQGQAPASQSGPKPLGGPMPYAQAVIAGGRGAMQAPMHVGRAVPAQASRGRGQGGQPRNTGSRGYKFSQNARNRPPTVDNANVVTQLPPAMPMTMVPPTIDHQAAPVGGDALTLSNLAEFPSDVQKNIIGDRLFPSVHLIQPELAGKITGMLLEMDIGDLLHLLESPDALAAKVNEAVSVLNAHAVKEASHE